MYPSNEAERIQWPPWPKEPWPWAALGAKNANAKLAFSVYASSQGVLDRDRWPTGARHARTNAQLRAKLQTPHWTISVRVSSKGGETYSLEVLLQLFFSDFF